MPLDFLTQAERQRSQRMPAAIAERNLRQHFHLSEADRAFVATFRGAISRLGVALHLGLLRYLGYLPDNWVRNVPAPLRAEGYPVYDEDLAHLSPARFEHINRLGKYTFAEHETLLRNGLRPLRQPGQVVAPTAAPA